MSDDPTIHFTTRPLDDPAIPSDVPDRPLAKAMLEVLYGLDTESEALGWDLAPTFGFVYQRGRASTADAEMLALEFSSLPEFGGNGPEAPRLYWQIVALADALRDFPAVVPSSLVAAVLITESWALSAADTSRTAEYQAVSKSQQVHTHPDRIECRVLQAADREGLSYMLIHERDSVVRATVSSTETGGIVPAAMDYFMAVAAGRNPANWAEFCATDRYRPKWPT